MTASTTSGQLRGLERYPRLHHLIPDLRRYRLGLLTWLTGEIAIEAGR